jgi:hypothetical protein
VAVVEEEMTTLDQRQVEEMEVEVQEVQDQAHLQLEVEQPILEVVAVVLEFQDQVDLELVGQV